MRYFSFIFILCLGILFTPVKANAVIEITHIEYGALSGGSSMQKLSDTIYDLAKSINVASSQMQKFGDMLFCSSLHGKAADWTYEVLGITVFEKRIIHLGLWFASVFLIAIGFMISMASAFYLFDIAFNLSVSICLLPIGIALYPFGWTKDKLKKVLDGIVYYVGVFIFLPLGILVANAIVKSVLADVFGGADVLEDAFANDRSDLIEDKLSLFTLSFLKVLLSYIVAFKVIPLFAVDFCQHFFGGNIVGNPMSQKLTEMIKERLNKSASKAKKRTADIMKHQGGKLVSNMGKEDGNFIQRAVYNTGKSMGKTQKPTEGGGK